MNSIIANLPDIYQELATSMDLVTERTIENTSDQKKKYNIKQLSTVMVKLMESQFARITYTSENKKQECLQRLNLLKPSLNILCEKIMHDTQSMQMIQTFDIESERLKTVHVFVDQVENIIFTTSYISYTNLTQQFLDDLAMLIDINKYIRRAVNMFEYDLISLDIFGIVYTIYPK